MLTMDSVKVNEKTFDAYTVPTQNVSMMMINAPRGMLACGYISVEAADKFGDALAIVRGVSCYGDMLKARVAAVSQKAAELGVDASMTGEEALLKMS